MSRVFFGGIEGVFRTVATLLVYLATASLLLMTALVVLSACMRYLVGRPFGFTEELVALLYMAMVFLAIPLATVQRKHISISILPQQLTTLLRYPLRLGAGLTMIAFCVWFTVASIGFSAESYRFGSITEQSSILLWPWMALIPLTMGFVAIISVLHLFQDVWRPADVKAPEEGSPMGDQL